MSEYVIQYEILDAEEQKHGSRKVIVASGRGAVDHVVEHGYLVQERLIEGAELDALRAAADEVEAEELKTSRPGEGNFGGLFVRNLLDRHPKFLEMLDFEPAVSLTRALIGPQIQCHAMVLRVSYPDLPGQGVEWHYHQRVLPEPNPPMFVRPQVIDHLIYLDDVDERTGPLVVLPGSHRWTAGIASGDFSDKPGQVVLPVPAGSMVSAPSSTWHKAMPTVGGGRKRRLLILGYSPTFMKPVDAFGGEPTRKLRESGDRETKELLGVSGYF
jgi:ectoine hydroxylase-related dioxygenase (phytanoyl-CoA dioxygenase family)